MSSSLAQSDQMNAQESTRGRGQSSAVFLTHPAEHPEFKDMQNEHSYILNEET